MASADIPLPDPSLHCAWKVDKEFPPLDTIDPDWQDAWGGALRFL
jgi:hypothetical protein